MIDSTIPFKCTHWILSVETILLYEDVHFDKIDKLNYLYLYNKIDYGTNWKT